MDYQAIGVLAAVGGVILAILKFTHSRYQEQIAEIKQDFAGGKKNVDELGTKLSQHQKYVNDHYVRNDEIQRLREEFRQANTGLSEKMTQIVATLGQIQGALGERRHHENLSYESAKRNANP
jgi:septal ring factor EnvC (AmiA/AmiB activator)